MRRFRSWTLQLSCAAIAVAACGAVQPSAKPLTAAAPDVPSMTNADIPPALAAQVRLSVTDLAQRLQIDPSVISVIEARAITWPDGSLGCPRPGMGYRQVPQDGALIRLSAQGRAYAYHSGSRQQPFLCDKAD